MNSANTTNTSFNVTLKSGQLPGTYDNTPHLLRRTEFETALKNYHMNPQASTVLKQTPLVTMTAPTSTGRNTIIRELIRTGKYYFTISDTTRPPRYNDGVLETNGVEYFFRTEDQMLEEIKNGEFLEAELIHNQQVSGQSIREIKKAHEQNKIAISDVDIYGAINTKNIKPDSIALLLLPPSFEEWLYRIQKRTPLTPLELYRRLQTATKVLKVALEQEFFVFVVNDDFREAVKTVDEIARLGIHHASEEQHSRRLAQSLYDQTARFLAQHAPEHQAH
jgi:guanylate kinase